MVVTELGLELRMSYSLVHGDMRRQRMRREEMGGGRGCPQAACEPMGLGVPLSWDR